MMKQTVLPFKLETTRDLITSQPGLGLLGEFAVGLGLKEMVDSHLPAPGSGVGSMASEAGFSELLRETNAEREEDQGVLRGQCSVSGQSDRFL